MAGIIRVFKRWIQMLFGKSVFHMNQKAGLYYEKNKVRGYYSDLRHKVSGASLIDINGVPYNQTAKGKNVYFAISIFQYGLGAYDLYIENNDIKYLEKFHAVVKWAIDNQNEDGSWNAFGWTTPETPFSSMAQAEGASLLCRAYVETKNESYRECAIQAIKFMVIPVDKGGTTDYTTNSFISFEENLKYKSILNGMIFSIWGLYDVCLICNNKDLNSLLIAVVNDLAVNLKRYDRRFWSNYDLNGDIASPFYHDLHIEQLKVLFTLFQNVEFKEMYEKWRYYQNSFFYSRLAFIVKAIQKIKKTDSAEVLVK